MVETTSISVHPDTKERAKDYRHHEPDRSWTDGLEAMMNVLPRTSTFKNGCRRCSQEYPGDHPGEAPSGVVFYYEDDIGDKYVSHWFCSWECLAETMEENQAWVPEEPDLVVVGGHEMDRTEIKGATFYIDEHTKEVGVPVPGGFDGESSMGGEYDYIGEPIYVYNEGRYRHHGVIKNIIHEEAHTGLIFDTPTAEDYRMVMEHHPSEEKRQEYAESQAAKAEE